MTKTNLVNHNHCPICHGKCVTRYTHLTDRLMMTPATFNISECSDCSLVFTNPLPVSHFQDYYPTQYLCAKQTTKFNLNKWYRFDQYRFDFNLLSNVTRKNISQYKNYLDIGCGSGERMEYVRERGIAKVFGLDIYDNLDSDLRDIVFNGDITEFKPNQKFELISLFHSLEHLDQPQQKIDYISKNLITEGGMLIIQVPNYSSWEREVFGARWFGFDTPRHLWHFTPRVVSRWLSDAGFEVIITYEQNAFWHPVTLAPSLYIEADPQRIWKQSNTVRPYLLKFYYLMWMMLTILTIPFSLIQSLLNRGSMLTIIAKKN